LIRVDVRILITTVAGVVIAFLARPAAPATYDMRRNLCSIC